MLQSAAAASSSPSLPDLDHELVERELERTRESRQSGPHAENILKTSAWSPRGRSDHAHRRPIKFYQVGSHAAGNRLLDPEQRALQADPNRSNAITKGHRACQGCGEALGARYALDAAMRRPTAA